MTRVSLNEKSQALWQRYNFEYLRYQYNLTPDDIVIDLGAYRGEWASEIHRRYKCKVVMVEPGPWIAGCEAGDVINKAAWLFDGKLRFGGQFYYTSIHEDQTHEYECFDINTLLAQYDDIALLKCNVEGAEYDLLEHVIANGLHKRIRNLQVQFHLIEGEDSEMRYDALAELLSETHDTLWRYRHCWENWRRK